MRRMKRRTWLRAAPLSVLLPAGIAEAMERMFLQAPIESPNAPEKPQGDAMTGSAKVYELRIYHVAPGKLDSLVARFRDYTDKLFAKHGMKRVAYWTALDEPVKSSTFFYILEHPSGEVAAANWKAFQDDPGWSTTSKLGSGYWLTSYSVSFRWKVARNAGAWDMNAVANVWTSPIITHTVTCDLDVENPDAPVRVNARAAGVKHWDIAMPGPS